MPNASSSSASVRYPRYSRSEIIQHLRHKVADVQQVLPVQKVVLFGSYAVGRATAASDIDVLIVYRGKPAPKAYSVARKRLELRGLELHIYAEEEAAALEDTLQRMTRDGIVIYDARRDA